MFCPEDWLTLVEEVGSDDSSDEESGMHADLFSVSDSDLD